ncbi:Hypothetical protein EUBREC_0141 [Agathobacter rectalis ATCC 33656]|uniref:Uncharacterized protein n=1 Tax=Agathobacter rectalis (strain ATCC 33656 / DSM 3377 / JCM 17463 / KCTC 5835 / VPI 0990) TaxID=515619 RepID=C4Z9U8_AGARV|nr:Hypothetical protein EUBREC_0141 [Agathobacter rectalis ATCC 33656]
MVVLTSECPNSSCTSFGAAPFLSFFSYRSFCHNRVSPFDIRQSELVKCFLRLSISFLIKNTARKIADA